MNRIDVWDGWRGLAIGWVLVGHFYNIESMGEHRLGVDIFFVLSGMLMSGILFEQRMPLKKFYVRRFSRIYPALLLYVLFWYAVAAQIGLEFQIREIFANLTFIRTYFPSDPNIWQTQVPMGHLWSLNVEEHAYVIMSLITLLCVPRQRAALVLGGLGLISVAIGLLYYLAHPALGGKLYYIRTESTLSFIFLSASYNLIKKQYHLRAKGWQPIAALMVATACYFYALPLWLTYSLTPILLAFAVNHLLDSYRWFQRILTFGPLRWLGIWSYSIYLWQQPFYKWNHIIPGGKLTGLILAIACGLASYYLVEQPLRAKINNYWSARASKKKSLAAATPTARHS